MMLTESLSFSQTFEQGKQSWLAAGSKVDRPQGRLAPWRVAGLTQGGQAPRIMLLKPTAEAPETSGDPNRLLNPASIQVCSSPQLLPFLKPRYSLFLGPNNKIPIT